MKALAWTRHDIFHRWSATVGRVTFTIQRGENCRGERFYRLQSMQAPTFNHQFFPSLPEAMVEAERLLSEMSDAQIHGKKSNIKKGEGQ
jgi:hypothetical protein